MPRILRKSPRVVAPPPPEPPAAEVAEEETPDHPDAPRPPKGYAGGPYPVVYSPGNPYAAYQAALAATRGPRKQE